MLFRAVIDNKNYVILEGVSLKNILEKLNNNSFIICLNKTSGKKQIVNTNTIKVVRQSSKTLEEIMEENN